MRATSFVVMGDKSMDTEAAIDTEAAEERKAADPYGDVALGVECAWPQNFPTGLTTTTEERAG
ncbi:MAG TPA: hypothetical protein VH600_11295 [Burkholderiales bacterium]